MLLDDKQGMNSNLPGVVGLTLYAIKRVYAYVELHS